MTIAKASMVNWCTVAYDKMLARDAQGAGEIETFLAKKRANIRSLTQTQGREGSKYDVI